MPAGRKEPVGGITGHAPIVRTPACFTPHNRGHAECQAHHRHATRGARNRASDAYYAPGGTIRHNDCPRASGQPSDATAKSPAKLSQDIGMARDMAQSRLACTHDIQQNTLLLCTSPST